MEAERGVGEFQRLHEPTLGCPQVQPVRLILQGLPVLQLLFPIFYPWPLPAHGNLASTDLA